MVAVEKGHMEVVKAMEKQDPGLVSFSVGSGSTMIHWALEESHYQSDYFKVCFHCLVFSYGMLKQSVKNLHLTLYWYNKKTLLFSLHKLPTYIHYVEILLAHTGVL